jgi:hypothetical protein
MSDTMVAAFHRTAAAGLAEAGVGHGDTVALLLTSRPGGPRTTSTCGAAPSSPAGPSRSRRTR